MAGCGLSTSRPENEPSDGLHWGLVERPICRADSPYVSLPSHDEAVARLVSAIETHSPAAVLIAGRRPGQDHGLAQGFRRGAAHGGDLSW